MHYLSDALPMDIVWEHFLLFIQSVHTVIYHIVGKCRELLDGNIDIWVVLPSTRQLTSPLSFQGCVFVPTKSL